jgi:hypothetical protein
MRLRLQLHLPQVIILVSALVGLPMGQLALVLLVLPVPQLAVLLWEAVALAVAQLPLLGLMAQLQAERAVGMWRQPLTFSVAGVVASGVAHPPSMMLVCGSS